MTSDALYIPSGEPFQHMYFRELPDFPVRSVIWPEDSEVGIGLPCPICHTRGMKRSLVGSGDVGYQCRVETCRGKLGLTLAQVIRPLLGLEAETA